MTTHDNTTHDNTTHDNINYILHDISIEDEGIDITQLMDNFDNVYLYDETCNIEEVSQQEDMYDIDVLISEHKNYEMNFTTKQLHIICDYYNLTKETKIYDTNMSKARNMKKEELILLIISFENDVENIEIVTRRKKLWFYLDELKSDKYTKKYVLW
jgi:hypothetical protein